MTPETTGGRDGSGDGEPRGGADGTDGEGPRWRDSLEAAREESRSEGKLIFLDLYDPG